jgi:hypothetical protein
MAKVEAVGVVKLHPKVEVTLDEMREWEPERIKRFFGGVARMVHAAGQGAQVSVGVGHEEATGKEGSE